MRIPLIETDLRMAVSKAKYVRHNKIGEYYN